MPYQDSLVSRWDMSDINPPDLGFIGQGADMTGVGLVAATDIVQGIHGNSMATEFNGSNEYTRRAEANWRSQDGQGTIVAWIKRATLGAWHGIFASEDEATTLHNFLFAVTSANVLAVFFEDSPGIAQANALGSTTIAAGVWYHVAVASDGSAYTMYVNGEAETVGATNSGVWLADINDRDNITIGAEVNTGVTNRFNGVIDSVFYYSQPLTQLQVADHMIATRQGRL